MMMMMTRGEKLAVTHTLWQVGLARGLPHQIKRKESTPGRLKNHVVLVGGRPSQSKMAIILSLQFTQLAPNLERRVLFFLSYMEVSFQSNNVNIYIYTDVIASSSQQSMHVDDDVNVNTQKRFTQSNVQECKYTKHGEYSRYTIA